jgi:hypothetical protein
MSRPMMEFRPSIRRKAAGISLLGLGAVGLVLPFLQGFLFLALGTFVLRHQYFWAHRGMGWIEMRWPETVAQVERLETRMITGATTRTLAIRERIGRLFARR